MPTYYPSTTTTENSTQITLTTGGIVTIKGSSGDPQLIIHNNSDSAYDPSILFKVGSTSPTTKFTLGVDDSDSDKFKIGTTTIDTNTRLTIDSQGKVGIGTNPDSKFHVYGDYLKIADSTGYIEIIPGAMPGIDFHAAEDVEIGTKSDWSLLFLTNSLERVTIKNDGRVGIGSTDPKGKLDIASTDGGLVVPRMNSSQEAYLSGVVNGTIIYNTTSHKFRGYANGGWTDLN